MGIQFEQYTVGVSRESILRMRLKAAHLKEKGALVEDIRANIPAGMTLFLWRRFSWEL